MSVQKVLLINTDDSMGGAAIACLRLLDVLNKNQGIEAKLLVQEKKKSNNHVFEIAKTKWQKRLAFLRFIRERLFFRFHEKNKEVRFAFSPANVGVDISQHPLVQEADILHIHWINFGFLSIESLNKLIALNKPIVFTMHDMWLITGGCHHSGDCENYQKSCGNCNQYLKNPTEKDLSNQVWTRKNTIFNPTPVGRGTITSLPTGVGRCEVSIIACSQWLANRAKKSSLFKKSKITSIPNPIDTNLFYPKEKHESRLQFGLPTNKKLVLFVAMKVSVLWKGFSYFEEGLNLLKTDNQELELIILGEADKELLEKLPYKSHALGRINDFEKISTIYSAADVFVIPSIQENLPNTIMESLACGTPAVGFEVGGIPEMIEHKKTGFLAKYKSAESLAEGIKWVLNEADIDNLSKKCREKVLQNYSQEVVANQYIEVYKQAISS